MDKKQLRILGAGFLAAAFVVTAGFAVQGHVRAGQYCRLVENGYQHAFAELTAAVGELDTALEKGTWATTPALFSALCTQAYGKALAAQTAIGELPYGNVELEQTAAFLAKTGDYAMTLARSAHEDGGCTGEERETLRALSAAASQLAVSLQELEADLCAGRVEPQDLAAVQDRLSRATDGEELLAGSAFQDIEADFPEVPALIYDGPFSDHLVGQTPKMLDGLPQVTAQEAAEAAAAFLNLKPEVFTLSSERAGNIPAYAFSAPVDGGTLWVEVSRAGGQILSVMLDRPVEQAVLTQEEAQQQAAAFLDARGYHDMVPSYFIQQDNVLTVNFAASQDGVLCYPDLVKVGVALDSGRILRFEAEGYLTNHCARDLASPSVDARQAEGVVEPSLEILSHQLAVIPTAGQYEVLCHEFKCRRPDGGHAIIYVNAQTGQEQQILLLLEDETGTLVL